MDTDNLVVNTGDLILIQCQSSALSGNFYANI